MAYARVMDTTQRPIPELVEERKALSAQLADINRKLEKLDAELFSRLETALNAFGMWGPSVAIPAQATHRPMPPPLPSRPALTVSRPQLFSGPKPTPPRPRSKEIGATIQEGAARHIRKANRPLKTREILELLHEDGIAVPGRDPMNNLSAHLSRSDQFVNSRHGWHLKQEPPEGGS